MGKETKNSSGETMTVADLKKLFGEDRVNNDGSVNLRQDGTITAVRSSEEKAGPSLRKRRAWYSR